MIICSVTVTALYIQRRREKMGGVLVTVVCITYNHEKYIRYALDGFLSQKTDFQYKIVIHDDASTDNTQAIIREYAEKYPELFVPILQEENQYQAGIGIMRNYIQPLLEGEYFALCEGDDYWCAPDKLQEQVDFMKNHEDYVACVHNTLRYDCRNNKSTLMYKKGRSRDITLEDVIWRGGSAFHTSSILAKKELFLIPNEIINRWFGDYSRAIYLTLSGKVRFLNKTMSVYRYFSKGSWTVNTFSEMDSDKAIMLDREKIDMLERCDKYALGSVRPLGVQGARDYQSHVRALRLHRLYQPLRCRHGLLRQGCFPRDGHQPPLPAAQRGHPL